MAKTRKSTKLQNKAVPKRAARCATKSTTDESNVSKKNPYAMSASRVVELAMAAGIIDKNGKLTPNFR